MQVKEPGDSMHTQPLDLRVAYEELGERLDAYERLLDDAMDGDATRFAREDNVDESWRVVEPLLTSPPPAQQYAKGSWGPHAAREVTAGEGDWHDPAP